MTYLNVSALSDLYESLNALQGLIFFVIGDAEHSQLRLTFIRAFCVHHKPGHKRYMDCFPKTTNINDVAFFTKVLLE